MRLHESKATFVTRLPADLHPGVYHIQLVNEENPEEDTTEELKLRVSPREHGECFELDEFARQLQAEALSRHNSSDSLDHQDQQEDDEDMRPSFDSYSPGLQSANAGWPVEELQPDEI